jgi:aminopeptidase-like protein
VSAQEVDYAARGREMHSLATRLWPIPRSLAGPAFRESLDIIEAEHGPIERHHFESGSRVLDWTVPPEWHIREAWVKGPDGQTVIDMRDSNLHVVSYSEPVHAEMELEELQERLWSLPDQPDAIPYRTSYYNRSWGFCLTENRRRSMAPGRYEVHIDAELRPGRLELGEITVPGQTDREVLLSTYLCHPSMANNELSGPMVVAQLADLLRARDQQPRFTYRLLFVPETIGAIAYLARFGQRLRERLDAGYVVTCIGDPGPFTYKRSRRGGTLADRAALHVLEHAGEPYGVTDYYPARSDERQYCSPGFDLPVGSLMRTPYFGYPEYHTSLDDLELVTAEALAGSLHMYHRLVECLEAARPYQVTVAEGEPELGSRGLYATTGGATVDEQAKLDMMFLLNYCDGSGDLLAAGERIGRPIWELQPTVERLVEHDLLTPVQSA